MKKDFGLIFWLHLILILIAWSTPWWLDWKFIFLGIVTLHIQWYLLEGCYLTNIETGKDKDSTFYYHYLSKIFLNLNKKRMKLLVRYVIPVIILATAILVQTN